MKLRNLVLMGGLAILFSAGVVVHAKSKELPFFYAYNDTNRMVTITVGNYFPTSYTLLPHSSTTVWVSTDNQNIHIKEIV